MPSNICTVTIVNNTDPAQNIFIISIFGTFVYSDESTSVFGDQAPNLNLAAGDRRPYSSAPGKYVTRFVAYITATDRTTGEERILQAQKAAHPGNFLRGEFIFGVQV
ncbi:MAG TPA: hypothetical protein VGN12_01245 [Pirellulales bacterium]|jgi:hypothetical protein